MRTARATIAAPAGTGFTLVEALLVVAVVSILLGLLLPALGGARGAARSAGCLSMERQFALGLARYAADADEWIPGFNTSGFSLRPPAPVGAIAALSRRAGAPVQINDWMSPALADQALPPVREARFYALLERFGCPAMELRAPVWIGGDQGALEMARWLEDHAAEPARGVSYLMPTNFQLFGGPRADPLFTQSSSRTLQELARVCALRADYRPRVDSLGSPARKLALADGFRYLDTRVIDFDASYAHANWGSFTERSACDQTSRSWGRRGGGGTGFNLSVVYRHAGRLNGAFWDGHAEPLAPLRSRDPSLWAPTGSRLQDAAVLDEDSRGFGVDPGDPDRGAVP
jgi:prepilin-type processing-associated H-X9-DG protein